MGDLEWPFWRLTPLQDGKTYRPSGGFRLKVRQVRYGSIAPLGLSESGGCRLLPGLTPWAIDCRPFGTIRGRAPLSLKPFRLTRILGGFPFSVPIVAKCPRTGRTASLARSACDTYFRGDHRS